MEIIFFFALFCLVCFSYLDLKTKMVSNWLMMGFFLIGLFLQVFRGNFLVTCLGMALIGFFSYVLWHFKTIGGADMKILVSLIGYINFIGLPNMLVSLLFFIIWFGLIGLIYGFSYKILFKEKEIPFVPAITLAFVLSQYFRIF